jgi:cytochrome c oxidase cbb3-type subunit IV
MYKEILRSITGIDIFPVVSLCLFVGVFAIVLVRTIRADKARLSAYASLPLDDATTGEQTSLKEERRCE